MTDDGKEIHMNGVIDASEYNPVFYGAMFQSGPLPHIYVRNSSLSLLHYVAGSTYNLF
jgi:hypothetical protein